MSNHPKPARTAELELRRVLPSLEFTDTPAGHSFIKDAFFGVKTPKLFWFFCTRAGPVRQTPNTSQRKRIQDRWEQIWETAVGSGFLGTNPTLVPPGEDLTTLNPAQNPQPELIYQRISSDISLLKRAKNSHFNSLPLLTPPTSASLFNIIHFYLKSSFPSHFQLPNSTTLSASWGKGFGNFCLFFPNKAIPISSQIFNSQHKQSLKSPGFCQITKIPPPKPLHTLQFEHI